MLGNVWQRHFTWLVLGVILFGLAAGAALAALTQPSPTRNAQAQTGLPAAGAAGSAGAASASPVTGARESNGAGGNASGGMGVVGTVATVDSTGLTVRGPQGDVKVKLAAAKIVKTTEGSTDDLKVGQRITAFAQQETDGSYTAASIQVSPADLTVRGAGTPFQGGGGANAARGQGQQGGDARSRQLSGTISAVDAGILTVATSQGDAKLKVTGARVQKATEGAATDLQSGQRVLVSGSQGSDGSIDATEVQVLPATDQQPGNGGSARQKQQ